MRKIVESAVDEKGNGDILLHWIITTRFVGDIRLS